jgi:hypothetical protein
MDHQELSADRMSAALGKGAVFVSFVGSPWQETVLSVPGAVTRSTVTDRFGRPLIAIMSAPEQGAAH